MCTTCDTDNTTPAQCKANFRARLVRALEIVDLMKGDVFGLDEHALALELYQLAGDHFWQQFPDVMAWCSVNTYYANGKPEEWPPPSVWNAHMTEGAARDDARTLQAKYKKEHEARPWWGPWKDSGRRFALELRPARIVDLVVVKDTRR